MARKYTRDNRGRFASAGGGATARGGRLKTASGNKRQTQKISALSGDRMSSVPKGAIGKTRKEREITMIDRPQAQRPAYNAGRAQQQAAIAARKAPKASAASKRIKAAAPGNTVANKTGQSKTLNKFNSRPEPTRGKYVNGRYVDKAKLTGRQPLDLGRGDDRAFGRMATKAARARAANKPTTQKERWAARSAMLSNAAAKNEAKAKRLFDAANTAGNTAFNTQPGRIAGRARMNAQTERSFRLQEKAAQQRSRAANLERLANTNKGDAAKGRAAKAEAIKASHKGLKKGDTIEGVLYGQREVVKVNAKSVTVKGGIKNFTIPWEFIKPKR